MTFEFLEIFHSGPLITVSPGARRDDRALGCGAEVPWFPHDNDSENLKELCHEAGRPAGCTNNGKLRRILTLVLS